MKNGHGEQQPPGRRLVRIGHRHRAVVVDGQFGKPRVHPMRGRRAEPVSPDALRHFAQSRALAVELLPRREQRAVVEDAVDAELEATLPQLFDDPPVDRIFGGDDVERRAQAPRLLQIGDPNGVAKSRLRFDVVGQDHGRAGALRPEPAKAQRLLALCDQGAAYVEPEQDGDAGVEGPAGEVGLALAADQDPPRRELGAARDRVLQSIEDVEQPRGEAERRRALGP